MSGEYWRKRAERAEAKNDQAVRMIAANERRILELETEVERLRNSKHPLKESGDSLGYTDSDLGRLWNSQRSR